MAAIGSWRNVNELSFLQHVDSMPFAFRYDARLTRMQFDGCIRLGLSGDPETPGNYVEYFVSVRMDFASVRWVIGNREDSHGHAIDSDRRARPMRSGANGEVAVNVEQATRDIDRNNSVCQSILLLSIARPSTQRSEEPDSSDTTIHHLVDGDGSVLTFRQASNFFVVHHYLARHYAIDQPSVKIGQRESVLRVVLGERFFAGKHRFGTWGAKNLDVVGVLGQEAFEITGVVGVELALNGLFWFGHRTGVKPSGW